MGNRCESSITQVAVYARGALVTRRVVLPGSLPAGEVTVSVPGVTALAEPTSVRAALPESTGRTVHALRATLSVSGDGRVVGPSVERVRALRAALHRIEEERAMLSELRARLAHLSLDPGFRARRAPAEARGVTARMADALAANAMLTTLLEDLDARAIDLDARARRAREDLAAEELRDAQGRAAERLGEGHPTFTLAVHLRGEGELPWLDVSYVVRAARWWPVYTLRIHDQARRAVWMAEALVVQRSGEDWRNVRLSLSTADLFFDARLPELPSLRFGCAQLPVRKGYRAAPAGFDAMFAGYDRAISQASSLGGAPAPMGPVMPEARPGDEGEKGSADDMEHGPIVPPQPFVDAEHAQLVVPAANRAHVGGSGGGSERMPSLAPASAPAPFVARKRMGTSSTDDVAVGTVPSGEAGVRPHGASPVDPRPLEPDDAWLDFDALRLAPPSDVTRRGRLVRTVDDLSAQARERAQDMLGEGAAPIGVQDPRVTRGVFDHLHVVEGLADVPADGLTHRVLVGQGEGEPTLRWRTVPCEASEVYREAELRNPFDAPLLGGPVDVYFEGSLLAVTSIDRIDRGGTLRVGMGLEPRLRVARNVRSREETTGLLGGDTTVTHEVSIELASALASPSLVEVLDRHPVTDDKDIEVTLVRSTPEHERYDQADRGAAVRGGMVWHVIVPAGGRSTVSYTYRIQLPSKHEIVGGNRRD